ncbi:inhibitor of prohead protease [Salmonella phage vB_SenM-AKM_NP4]|uniref:Inhibitor of prohead protease n=1 Tax=Salmonella phage S16 TaxID=1087482 RepID=M1EAG9_BPS16|nr:minor head protein inhibitor of protease [Salmonella phage vB_SenM-S16]AEO97115.1 inhibitor of prohead protease [Salmonella phage vB_SenM-S16]WDR21838.1 inhibitor of prohead protease [Salmonella phage vB_SenM_UTK0003]WLI71799.1 inhibitor of prohead protease [Salmonella phage vB_SenM-AKM_NP4]
MLDMNYIEEIRVLEKKEAKDKLDEYASQFGIKLKKTKSFENMLLDLEAEFEKLADAPLPEDNDGISISDLIDDDKEEQKDLVQPEDKVEVKELIIDSPAEETITVLEVAKTKEIPEDAVRIPETASADEIMKIIDDTAVVENKSFSLPESFNPHFQLMGKNPGYYTLPWWIYQWISENPDWKERPLSFPHATAHQTLLSLIYYIQRDGFILIRETRNSSFVRLY